MSPGGRRIALTPAGKTRRETPSEARSAGVSGLPDYAFDRRWHWAAIAFLILTTLVRLAMIGSIEPAPGEATYWDGSRRLALGHYSQAPMVGYVIRAATLVFGTNAFGFRIGMLAASAGMLLCGYVLARRLFSPLTGLLVVILLGLNPLLELLSLAAACDPLLVFFWSLAAVWLERALFSERRVEQDRAWTFVGIAVALGFLSERAMLFLAPCLLLFLLISPPHRIWLRRPQPYVAFLIVPLLYYGVSWWNAGRHGWNFPHLLFLVNKAPGTPVRRLVDTIGSQALLVGPALFIGALIASVKSFTLESRTAGGQRCRFLACMGLPALVFFCLMSLKSNVGANWTACAWLSMTILWAGWLTAWAGRSRRDAFQAFALAGLTGAAGLVLMLLALFPVTGPLRNLQSTLRYSVGASQNRVTP